MGPGEGDGRLAPKLVAARSVLDRVRGGNGVPEATHQGWCPRCEMFPFGIDRIVGALRTTRWRPAVGAPSVSGYEGQTRFCSGGSSIGFAIPFDSASASRSVSFSIQSASSVGIWDSESGTPDGRSGREVVMGRPYSSRRGSGESTPGES